MTDETRSSTIDQAPGASSVFYKRPELLIPEDHADLGLNPGNRPFDFCRSVRAVPLTSLEIVAAQRHYPIIFSSIEKPSLLAVVGVMDDENLFVDANGHWEPGAYVPAYLRCHPFALASRTDEQYAVAVDMEASTVARDAELPFFDGNALTPQTSARVDHCVEFEAQAKVTAALCQRLADRELLAGQELTLSPDDGGEAVSVAKYVSVHFEKLESLPAEDLLEMHRDGTLALLYAHRFSLDLWRDLLRRRAIRQSAH